MHLRLALFDEQESTFAHRCHWLRWIWLGEFACTRTCANVRSAFSAGSMQGASGCPEMHDRIHALAELRSLIVCGR